MIHCAGITNLDIHGLSCNPSLSDEDLTGAKWYGDCDREAVPCWHAVVYVTLFSGAAIEVLIQGLDDETDRPQTIVDI